MPLIKLMDLIYFENKPSFNKPWMIWKVKSINRIVKSSKHFWGWTVCRVFFFSVYLKNRTLTIINVTDFFLSFQITYEKIFLIAFDNSLWPDFTLVAIACYHHVPHLIKTLTWWFFGENDLFLNCILWDTFTKIKDCLISVKTCSVAYLFIWLIFI